MGGGEGRVKKLASQRATNDIPSMVKQLKTVPQEIKAQLTHLVNAETLNFLRTRPLVSSHGMPHAAD